MIFFTEVRIEKEFNKLNIFIKLIHNIKKLHKNCVEIKTLQYKLKNNFLLV